MKILTLAYADGREETFGVADDLEYESIEPWTLNPDRDPPLIRFYGPDGFFGWAIAEGLLWATVHSEKETNVTDGD